MHSKKILLVATFLTLVLGLAVFKAAFVQVLKGQSLQDLARRQVTRSLDYMGTRGNISDRQGRLLATSIAVDSVYAEPSHIEDPFLAAEKLALALHIPKSALLKRLGSDAKFVWVKRRISPEESNAMRRFKLSGIKLVKEEQRFYPNAALLGQTIGTVSVDGDGQSGVERALNGYLKPKQLTTLTLTDARGTALQSNSAPSDSDLRGQNVVLTIDRDIQLVAESALAESVVKHHAKGGFVIVMEIPSGDLLAIANYPPFNPNQPGSQNTRSVRNDAISLAFEPGSIFKIFTLASALDNQTVGPDDKIDCDNGIYKIGNLTIRDISKKKILTPPEILMYSSNIGIFKIAEKTGKQNVEKTIRNLVFGSPIQMGLVEEARGRLASSETWGLARFANISFGYGIMVTGLELIQGIATIANGGLVVRPKLIKNLLLADGTPIELASTPLNTAPVIAPRAAKQLSEFLAQVTENDGSGVRAHIDGIRVSGKTGTAELVDSLTGTYDKKRNRGSFIGFAPTESPKIAALVVIDEPQQVAYGGVVAAPVWQHVVESALTMRGFLTQSPPL